MWNNNNHIQQDRLQGEGARAPYQKVYEKYILQKHEKGER